jgi:UDPglucose 6-dehydrogenase
MREAPSRELLEALWTDGATVAAYDPKAAEEAERIYPEALADGRLLLAATKEEATGDADALVICTEWKRFMAPNFDQLAGSLRQKLIFDGRNLYDPERLAELGWTYYAIGRRLLLARWFSRQGWLVPAGRGLGRKGHARRRRLVGNP